MAWDQLATSVKVRTMRELVQPFIALQRPWALFEVFNDEKDEVFVDCDERAPYALDRRTNWIHEKSFNLVQDLSSNVNATSRPFCKNYLEHI